MCHFMNVIPILLSLFIQGIPGAEGSPGKDGLVGERVRLNSHFLWLD